MPMFGASSRKAPFDLDADTLMRLAQSAQAPAAPSGMFGGGSGAPANTPMPGPPALQNHATERVPLNFGAAPPDDIFGTKPIGTPGIGEGLPGAIPMDARVNKALQPKFFDKNGAWRDVLGILGDAMAAAGGGQATYMPMKLDQQKRWQDQQRWQAEQKMAQSKWDWEKKKDMRPDVKVLGRTAISIPFEGDPSVLYQAPTDADQYAASLGFNEGDEGYADAVMDFTLRSNGPTAYGQRRELEDQRYGNRVNLRQVPTYANLHPRNGARGGNGNGGTGGVPRPPRNTSNVYAPILDKMRRGIALTPGEQQVLSFYGRRGGKGTSPLPITPAPSPVSPRVPSPKSGGPVRVSSPREARNLPPGTEFMTHDGRIKVAK